jgi:alginate O-acetyltransferase complex protein AlgI
MRDFWRRWHISLSTWLRDYLYIPLGGSAEEGYKTYRNLLLTMLLGGLWHGANWTFVAWGGLHGSVLSIERFVDAHRAFLTPLRRWRVGLWPKRILTFHLVCLGWIFFRADSLASAGKFLRGFGHVAWEPGYAVAFKLLALFAIPLFLIDLYLEHSLEEYLFEHETAMTRVVVACGMLALVAFFSANEANAFIYFQF